MSRLPRKFKAAKIIKLKRCIQRIKLLLAVTVFYFLNSFGLIKFGLALFGLF